MSGDRDALAEISLLRGVVDPLRPLADLMLVDDGDHSFHVRRASGRTSATVLGEALIKVCAWIKRRSLQTAGVGS